MAAQQELRPPDAIGNYKKAFAESLGLCEGLHRIHLLVFVDQLCLLLVIPQLGEDGDVIERAGVTD